MLKKLGLLSLMIIVAGCSTATKVTSKITQKSYTAEEMQTRWDMEGRGPEWIVSITDQRFHGSFPGRYEGRMIKWDVAEKDNVTTLTTKSNKQTKITLTVGECSVDGIKKNFTHTATVNINQQTFTGCAKHK